MSIHTRTLRYVLLAFIPAALLALAACSKPADNAPKLVLVEVAPLVSLVEPLLARDIEIRPIVPAGVSPHGYQLTPSDAADLARASLVITVGPSLEPAITRAIQRQTPSENVFSIAAALGIDAEACEHPEHAHDHSQDHEGHDHAPGADPHLWLDPTLMLDFVQAIDADLATRQLVDPNHAGYLKTLIATITTLDYSFSSQLEPFQGKAIITHHDAFRRVADRYGLTVAQVIRPVSSVEPTPGDLAEAIEAIREHNAGAIFIEPQFSDALPRRIADQLGVKMYKLDPVGNTDWFDMMRFNLSSLVQGLSEPPAPTEAQPETAPESEG